mmetsp:Transcript_6748/g.7367  ORF Transcript_6748/g.7367 Transcript_6748/m.7367 type:complete len:259 (+) Transcript_6748:73-849(+)
MDKPILTRFSLKDKVCLVTGGGQGIGRGYCHALGEAGASVAVVDIVLSRAETVVKELQDKKIDALAIKADVTNKENVNDMIAKIIAWKGALHIAVNNAGIVFNESAETMTEDHWDSVINVNLKGVFLCSQAEAKAMFANKYGKIINTASMSGSIVNHPQPQCSYNASKAGVVHLTKSMAAEWAPKGIRVNSISPGYINTELNQKPHLEEIKSKWLEDTPAGVMGEVSDLQGAVVFLASPASDFMTGHDMIIDGGFTLW